MLITFQDQYGTAQSLTKLSDSVSTARFKRDVNAGGTRMMSLLGRSQSRLSRFADLVVGQQYYQVPRDAQTPREVIAYNGTIWVPLIEIVDEMTWRQLNRTVIEGPATHYFIRGSDEIGLYPAPAANATAGLELVFERRQLKLTQDDFTTGTITVNENDATITHSAAGFTAAMIGRGFEVTDGSDKNWYKIASYTDPSNMELGNVFQGSSGSAVNFRIGEVMDLPEEYLEAPIDYAMWRYELGHDTTKAATFQQNFKDATAEAMDVYGRKGASAIVHVSRPNRVYDPLRGTPTITGT